ncbi:uncharacterized protein LOC126249742 [Schistocerca nitens]|uniref:uncharacterized protein LOC126190707 n=1 Tax=Schistocerca cancellata TaxID=274614 RepID=UPI002118107D|nr:uncharacterized protein LOC126190707 [Schistocerca cancellata]XP_049807381.1 uncharacterized protein LOC126249742 [Schistocerca nitens]
MDRRPIIALLLLVVCVHSGFSVVCYQCNSQYDPRCGDPFDPYTLGEVNCSMKPPLEHLGKIQPTICRKIVQRVYGKTRVVRGCGYLTDDSNPDGRSCFQRSGTHDVHVQYCTCNEDRCNSARSRSGPAAGALLAIALLAAGAGAGASVSAAPSAL